MNRRLFWLAFVTLLVTGALILIAGGLAVLSSSELGVVLTGWRVVFLVCVLAGMALLGSSTFVLLLRPWLMGLTTRSVELEEQLDQAKAALNAEVQARQLAEGLLAESDQSQVDILDQMTDAINLVDRQMRVVLTNRAYDQFLADFGFNGPFIGKNLFEILSFLPEKVRQEYSQVFASGEALLTEEWVQVGDRRACTETLKIPVREQGEVVQVLTVVRETTRRKQMEEELQHFSQELEQRVSERTLQLEGANRRLQDTIAELEVARAALQRWTWQLEALYEVSLSVSRGMELQSLLELILSKTSSMEHFSFSSFYLLRQDAPVMELAACMDLSQQVFRLPQSIPVGVGVTGNAAQKGEVMEVVDLSACTFALPVMASPLTGRALAIPLKVSGRVLGVFTMADPQPGEFDRQDLAVLKLFADLAAVAVENDYQKTLGNRLQQFALQLAEVDTLEAALELCLDAAVDLSGQDCGGIYLLEESTQDLVLVGQRNLAESFVAAIGRVEKGSWRYQMVMEGLPVYGSTDELVASQDTPVLEEGLRSIGVIPIFYQGALVGCFNMGSHSFADVPEQGRKLLEIIAVQVGNVIGRLHTERKLHISEMTARTLLNTTKEGAILLGRDGVVLAINDAAAKAFATNSDAMMGRQIYEFMPSEVIQHRRPLIEDALRADSPPIITVDPEFNGRIVEHYFYPIRDEDGNVVSVAVFTHDITALRAHAAVLEESNARLRELDRLKSQFLANVSHELRTPLNSIIGFSEVLMDGLLGQVSTEQAEALTSIWNSSQFLLALIGDLLDYSKISTGQMDLNLEPVDVYALCSELQGVFVPIMAAKSQQLVFDCGQENLTIQVDRLRLKQVLVNLLSNANKFTPENGHIQVTCAKKSEDWIVFCVMDDGIGIPEQDQELIFEEFRQVRVNGMITHIESGVGLGLAISKRLVELHGGRIWVESQPDAGARFCFELPNKR